MARRSATPALSPKLLKHFAVATVVLTGLLAILASGEDWGAQAQVKAVEAKNQLAETEAEKLGTRKVASTLKVANKVGPASFGDDEGGGFSGGGSGGGGGYAPRVASPLVTIPVRPGLRKPGTVWGSPNDPTKPPMPPGGEQEPAQSHPSAPPAPTAQDLANITASSARRSGGAGSGD